MKTTCAHRSWHLLFVLPCCFQATFAASSAQGAARRKTVLSTRCDAKSQQCTDTSTTSFKGSSYFQSQRVMHAHTGFAEMVFQRNYLISVPLADQMLEPLGMLDDEFDAASTRGRGFDFRSQFEVRLGAACLVVLVASACLRYLCVRHEETDVRVYSEKRTLTVGPSTMDAACQTHRENEKLDVDVDSSSSDECEDFPQVGTIASNELVPVATTALVESHIDFGKGH